MAKWRRREDRAAILGSLALPAHRLIFAPDFAPLVPPPLLAALAVAAMLVLALAWWRRARGAGWRAAGFAVLLIWLAGPMVTRQTLRPLADVALLVVDHSASMHIGRRAALARQAVRALTAAAARHPGLRLRQVIVRDHDRGTRIMAALRRAAALVPANRYAGAIVVTDGETPPAPAPPGGPLHLLLTAHGPETDRALRVLRAPPYGVVGHQVTLVVKVADHGVAHPGGTARLTLRRQGQPARIVTVPVGRAVEIPVPIRRAGPVTLALDVAPLPGEVSTLNNSAVLRIQGVRDRLRVLLVSGNPHRGERTWRRLLDADPSVDLVHFTILRPPQKVDRTPLSQLSLIPFPVDELFARRIDRFDLIILDRFADEGLLATRYIENIADYVRQGGALMLDVGPEFTSGASLAETPLRAVLPARPADGPGDGVVGRFRPVLTRLGKRHPVTAPLAASGRWGPWYRYVPVQQVHGNVLMRTPDGAPLLILDRVGRGRVGMLLSDQIWLWARGHDGGGPDATLLRRVVHWLMREPALAANALRARIAGGELRVRRRRLVGTAAGVARLRGPGGVRRRVVLTRVAPGMAEGRLRVSPGLWRVRMGGQTAYAAAPLADPAEYADLRATAARLGPVARRSGGAVVWLGRGIPALRRVAMGAADAGPGWIGLPRRGAATVTGVARVKLLPAWVALPLMLGLLAWGWWREGR